VTRAVARSLTFWHVAPHARRAIADLRSGARLAEHGGMRHLLSSSLVVALLCGPAVADPAQPTVRLKVSVTSGKDVRHYEMALVEHTCSEVRNSVAATHDEIKTCMHGDTGAYRFDLEWKLSEGDRSLATKAVAIAKRGDTIELTNTVAKLAITVQ
jgi:hypothetical protein